MNDRSSLTPPGATALNREFIDQALANTPFAGRFHHFPTIGSTNTYALEQARQAAPHGSYYIADEQTAGRGRSNHQWHSARAQGLYCSVLLRPAITPAELVWLPLLAGLAAHRAIQQVTGLAADLRWPNDILIGPRKTAGILVEAQTESSAVTAAVVGIGINLHQQAFPEDLATPATSLDLELATQSAANPAARVSRQQILIALLQALDEELPNLASAATRAMIPVRIESISTWVRNRDVAVHGPQPCRGITAGLDGNGFLRVDTDAGRVTVTTGGLRAASS